MRNGRASGENAAETGRIDGVTGEDALQARRAEVLRHDLAEEVPEVGGDREVAPLVELLALQAGPFPQDTSAVHSAPDHQYAVTVAVVGAAGAVLGHGAAELRHRDQHDIFHTRAEVVDEGAQAARELAQLDRQRAVGATLREVRVPSVDVDEGDLEADV